MHAQSQVLISLCAENQREMKHLFRELSIRTGDELERNYLYTIKRNIVQYNRGVDTRVQVQIYLFRVNSACCLTELHMQVKLVSTVDCLP